ncbi:hypothetical protein D3C87_1621780 [compost metagenome]
MEQGIKPGFFFRMSKNTFAQLSAVKGAVGLDKFTAKMFCDSTQCGCAGLYHLSGTDIGINNVDAQTRKCVGDGAFATSDAAR